MVFEHTFQLGNCSTTIVNIVKKINRHLYLNTYCTSAKVYLLLLIK